jgi:hypothetical protein
MCIPGLFGGGSAPKSMPTNTVANAPPIPSAPTTAAEENQGAVNDQLEQLRRRRGRAATQLTGGLGDTSYGTNVAKPSVTALGNG